MNSREAGALSRELPILLRARFKITFRPRRSTPAGAIDGLGTTREWTCPMGCGGEGPSPLSARNFILKCALSVLLLTPQPSLAPGDMAPVVDQLEALGEK